MNFWKDLFIIILFSIGSLFVVSSFPGENQVDDTIIEDPGIPENLPPPEKMVYGIPASSYNVAYHKIKPNHFLSEILHSNGIQADKIHEISLLPDSLLDARKLKTGNRYAIFRDEEGNPAFFIYEKDPVNYVTIRLNSESIEVRNGSKPLTHVLKKASGTIVTSLWESMKDSGINPILAIELSEIYAWSIDFFGLQSGDSFKLIYEESYIDSVPANKVKVHGAWFKHNGMEFWAIPFIQEGKLSFFDEEGNSLRKAFLKAPLRFSRISSRFSNSRLHPILKIYRPHHGIDYAAPVGTPVLAVGDGVVMKAEYSKGAGYYVKIKHNSIYSTSYLHLRSYGKGIRQGAWVKQGDIIGYVGSTGLSTGPHLDFRFYKNGTAVNPLLIEAPPVEPVSENNRKAFNIVKEITMRSINAI
ncbi:MAG: peptidoglycan DD-metalloendopeptidase family protein [Bacteroidales bacterium]|nr:peptidoglycan DD-metalloendopeptidase family protein [Bacteroidales bacterium]